MTTEAEYRKERIERLIHELEYELTRGVMDHEIEESLHWRYIIPVSRKIPNGVVVVQMQMWPATRDTVLPSGHTGPRLKLVEK
jgi:hypothetical protein